MNKGFLKKQAKKARENRLEKMNTMIGYCYQNAEEMSKQLQNKNIDHEIYYVGIINDVVQYTNADLEQCIKANKEDIYDEEVPEYKYELPDTTNHYVTVVENGNTKIIVEPCSELRDHNFRDIYVGEWPDRDYLILRDSKISKEDHFDHFNTG